MPDRNPRILAPFFGPQPVLPPQTMRTLLLVSLGLFFENYDLSLLNAALPQIAADFGVSMADTGPYLGAIRLGGIGAFLVIPFADRIGRRFTFLVCLAGMSLATFATALAATPLQFTLFQMICRVFLLTAATLAVVILVEELPAGQRGGGIAMLGILGGIGFGVGALLYGAIDLLPFGWRALYALGVLPVFALPFLHRSLTETRRFEAVRGAQPATAREVLAQWVAPIADLARKSPRSALAVGLAGALGALSGISFHQYTSWFVKEHHGWTPGQFALLIVGGGLIGMLGNVLGGRGSDRFGRRRIAFLGWVGLPLFVALFCLGPPETLVVSWGLAILCGSAAEIVLRTVATELFPTLYRATAGGWLVLVQTVGWSVGLVLASLFATSDADLPRVIAGLSLASVPAALVFIALVPETGDRELDELD
jgi:AAHS family benzoate transporter-like MFS transporter